MFSLLLNELSKLMEAHLVKQIKKIKVARIDPVENLTVDNPTDLPLIALEEKSAVFQLDETRSVTIYRKIGEAEKEYHLLRLGENYGITPHAYEYGPHYVVMDLIVAPRASKYLETNSLTREFAQNLLQLHAVSIEIGLSGDHSPSDIYVMPDGTLKAAHISDKTVPPDHPPKKLLKGLGYRVNTFLEYVKDLEPLLYEQWTNHPEFLKLISKAMH